MCICMLRDAWHGTETRSSIAERVVCDRARRGDTVTADCRWFMRRQRRARVALAHWSDPRRMARGEGAGSARYSLSLGSYRRSPCSSCTCSATFDADTPRCVRRQSIPSPAASSPTYLPTWCSPWPWWRKRKKRIEGNLSERDTREKSSPALPRRSLSFNLIDQSFFLFFILFVTIAITIIAFSCYFTINRSIVSLRG